MKSGREQYVSDRDGYSGWPRNNEVSWEKNERIADGVARISGGRMCSYPLSRGRMYRMWNTHV
jgi:hypothetical protein